MFSGLGGLSSVLGLNYPACTDYIVVRLIMSWWQRRNAPAYASNAAPGFPPQNPQANMRTVSASAPGLAARRSISAQTTTIRLNACSVKSRHRGRTRTSTKLHTLATPEMVVVFHRRSRGQQQPGSRQQGFGCETAPGAISPKPGAKARRTTRRSVCTSRWSTRRSTAQVDVLSRVAKRRSKSQKFGPSTAPQRAG